MCAGVNGAEVREGQETDSGCNNRRERLGGQVVNSDKSGEGQASCWNPCIIQQFVYGDWLEGSVVVSVERERKNRDDGEAWNLVVSS